MRWEIGLAGLLACAPPPPPAPHPTPAPPPTVALPIASVEDASALPIPPPGDPVLREPAEVACRLAGAAFTADRLRVRADGASFARADRVRATLAVPIAASPTESVVVIDDGRITLHAVLPIADTHLFAASSKPLLGVVTPTARTELAWVRSSAGTVRVALDVTSALRAPSPFEVDVSCTDLGIVAAGYDARASVTKLRTLPKRDVVREGVPLAPSATAAPVAELAGGVQVEVVETRAGKTHVLLDHPSYVVSGWVAAKDLGPPGLRGMFGSGVVGAERGYGMHRLSLTRCSTELPLFVEIERERVNVGAIHANAGFKVGPDEKRAFVAIELPESQWLAVEKEARLLVESSALAACRPSSPGR